MYKNDQIEAEIKHAKEARRNKWKALQDAPSIELSKDVAFYDGYIMALERAISGGLFFANQHKQDKAALV